jgi:hypothetical protein
MLLDLALAVFAGVGCHPDRLDLNVNIRLDVDLVTLLAVFEV